MCVYNVVVMCMVGVTITLVIGGRANITYTFQAACIFFCTSTTLALIFIPKVSKWLFK